MVCSGLRFLQPKRHNSGASTAAENSSGLELKPAIVVAEAVTVSVVDTGAISGVTLDGEKLHDAPEGKPEQLNWIAELNAFCWLTVTDILPLLPASTVSDVGEAAMEKSGGSLMVYTALAMALSE